MSGSLLLYAWPDFRRADVVRWHEALFADALPSRAKNRRVEVALFGACGEDDPEDIRWCSKFLTTHFDCRVEPVRLVRRPTPAAEARAIVNRADILYFTGGDQFLFVRAAQRTGLDELLRKRHAEGACVGAFSAGAIAIGPWWPEWPETERPDLPEEGADLVPCVGLNDRAVFDFHAEEDDWEELHACMRLLRAKDRSRRWHGCGVPTRGGVRIGRDGAVQILGDGGPWLAANSSGVRRVKAPVKL